MNVKSISSWHVHYWLDWNRNLITFLPFNICRWQAEDEDVEDVHGAIVDHCPFFTSRPLWRP